MNEHIEHQPITSSYASRINDSPLKKFFEASVRFQASDVLAKPNAPVRLRLRGALKNIDATPFTPQEFENIVKHFLTPEQLDFFNHYGSIDLSYAMDEDNRFRVNVFRTSGQVAIAARRVSSQILNYEQLYLPACFKTIAEEKQGLVLLAGVTGSGKSTTIASMLQQINQTRPCHIVTIEDPIEYIFKDAKAVVNQREVGIDVPDFTVALRALVRENPDVVLIGEMRDKETFQAALQAAETGHLVFGTIHASSATQVFNRIYNLFTPDEREHIRTMFAYTMKAVIYQKLLETLVAEIHRVPAVELLLNTSVVANYILEAREHELGDVIRTSQEAGMIDFNQSLVELVNKEYIHPRVALSASHNPDELKMRMKGIRTGTG